MKTSIALIISIVFLSLGTVVAQRGNNRNTQRNNSYKNTRVQKHTRIQKVRRTAHVNYRGVPRRGTNVSINTGYVSVNFGNTRYRCRNGVFYRPRGSEFVVTRAPIGIRINTLPVGHRRMTINNRPYFYYYGTYYVQPRPSVQQYEVVDAPIGAVVYALPFGYDVITLNNREYYRLDGVYYEPRINQYDEEYYVIVQDPINGW